MSTLPILKWPDPRLSEVCMPVEDPDSVAALVTDMFETMYAAPGRGLAAPQVGHMVRLFVMDVGWKDGEMAPLVCLNPRLAGQGEGHATGSEGCLSVPGVAATVSRSTEITLIYTDLSGQTQEVTMTGAASRVALHEIDHLDGVMHFDRIDAPARAALLAEYAGQG